MGLFSWLDTKVRGMHWYDISLTKISLLAIGLFLAKVWPGILGLDWYWYLVIAIAAALVPWYSVFAKKDEVWVKQNSKK